jgi:hypothetical protein
MPAAFKQGSHICVEGELRSREYETNGAKFRTYDIVASSIVNLRAGQRYTAQAPSLRPCPPTTCRSSSLSCHDLRILGHAALTSPRR